MYTLYIEDINGGQTHEHPFEGGELVVGRSREKCDIVLPADNVSRRHAKVYTTDSGCFVQDLGSANGVFVDGARIRDVREIEPSCRMRIGDYILYVKTADGPGGQAHEGHYARLVGRTLSGGQSYYVREPVSLVGRGKDTAITVIDPSVSRIHAKLTVTQSGDLVLQDLKSSNGTLVNEQRIEQVVLRHGDAVRFGNVEFALEVAGEEPLEEPDGPATVAPDDLQANSFATDDDWSTDASDDDDLFPLRRQRRRMLLAVAAVVAVVVAVVLAVVFWPDGSTDAEAGAARAEDAGAQPDDEERERQAARKRHQERQVRALVEADLELAERFVTQRRWDDALPLLERAIGLDAENEAALAARRKALYEKPNEDLVQEAHESAQKRDFARALEAYRRVPADSVYRRDAEEAVSTLQGKRTELLEAARSAWAKRDWEIAYRRYDEVLQVGPADPEIERLRDKAKAKIERQR